MLGLINLVVVASNDSQWLIVHDCLIIIITMSDNVHDSQWLTVLMMANDHG